MSSLLASIITADYSRVKNFTASSLQIITRVNSSRACWTVTLGGRTHRFRVFGNVRFLIVPEEVGQVVHGIVHLLRLPLLYLVLPQLVGKLDGHEGVGSWGGGWWGGSVGGRAQLARS